MKPQTGIRLAGQFTVLGFAVLMTQVIAWMVATIVDFLRVALVGAQVYISS